MPTSTRRNRCPHCGGIAFGERRWCPREAAAGSHKPYLNTTKYDGWLTKRFRLGLRLDRVLKVVGW